MCSGEVPAELSDVLGEAANVSAPTWASHLYSCRYTYSGDASFELSVKELSGWPQTEAYFDHYKTALGDKKSLLNLGQGAFQTDDGSVVVRKDWKVLYVDVADLPTQFGKPPTSAGDVAITIADVILACWAGD